VAQTNACKVLFMAAATAESAQLAIGHAGGIEACVDSMKEYEDDDIVMEGCLLALTIEDDETENYGEYKENSTQKSRPMNIKARALENMKKRRSSSRSRYNSPSPRKTPPKSIRGPPQPLSPLTIAGRASRYSFEPAGPLSPSELSVNSYSSRGSRVPVDPE